MSVVKCLKNSENHRTVPRSGEQARLDNCASRWTRSESVSETYFLNDDKIICANMTFRDISVYTMQGIGLVHASFPDIERFCRKTTFRELGLLCIFTTFGESSCGDSGR